MTTTTEQERSTALAILVRTLSGRWPRNLSAATPRELPITPEQLGVLLATWEPLDFADAFARCDAEALRVLASNPITMDAVTGLAAHALAAIEAHAREELLAQVQIHRDFCDRLRHEVACERERPRESDESYFGVASEFRSRA